MLKTYTADYAFRPSYTGSAVVLDMHRTTGESSVGFDGGMCTNSHADTTSLRVPLTSLAQFASIAVLPETAEPLHVWAKSVDIGARRSLLGCSAGALVGLIGVLPFWPVVITTGVLGGIIGGAMQYIPLRQMDRIDQMLANFANLAREAEDAPVAMLERIPARVHLIAASFDDLGAPTHFLEEALIGLIEDAIARQVD